MRKLVFTILVIVAVALAFGVYWVEKLPKTNTQGFSAGAADVSSTAFNELSKGRVTKVLSKDVEQNKHVSRITQTLQVILLSGSEKASR